MGIRILDGHGRGTVAGVDEDGRIEAAAITETQVIAAVSEGKAYNMVSVEITLTTATVSGIFYIKNDDPNRDIVVDHIYVCLGKSNSTGDVSILAYSNPTAGTLLSAGTSITPHNKNLGVSIPAIATVLSGTEGNTVTDGTLCAARIEQDKTLVSILDGFYLANGTSLAITVTPPTSNTSMKIRVSGTFFYVA